MKNYSTNGVLQQNISCTGDFFFHKMPNLSAAKQPPREQNIAPKDASRANWLLAVRGHTATLNGKKQVEAKLEAKIHACFDFCCQLKMSKYRGVTFKYFEIVTGTFRFVRFLG